MISANVLNTKFYREFGVLLTKSFMSLVGQRLLTDESNDLPIIDQLFEHPLPIVAHDASADPVFVFGNKAALALFEMSWDEFTQLPSRYSAELKNRDERQRLLRRVSEFGYVHDYQGVRVSASGRRFYVSDAIVWNVSNEQQAHVAQAAFLKSWDYLDD